MAVYNHVLFHIDNEVYAVDVADAGSIEKNVSYHDMPGMPSFMKGVFELRNELIPVISIREIFNRKEKSGSEYELVLSDINGQTIAYLVDHVDSIVPMEVFETDKIPLLHHNSQEYIKRIGNYKDSIVVVLDLSKMLNNEQFAEITSIISEKKKKDQEALIAAKIAEQKRKEEEDKRKQMEEQD